MAAHVTDIALVGVGGMAAQHVPVLRGVPGVRIVSCVSRQIDRAGEFAKRHDIAAARSLDDLRRNPQADALWICVSADAMAQVARELAPLGLPMFLEKPVGLDPQETAGARDAIRVPHMVGLNRRFYEVIRKGKELIDRHGGLRAIEVQMPEDLARVPATHSARTRKQWQFANSVHLIDLFRFFGGEPAEVKVQNEVKSDSDRSYSALLRFRGGAHGVYHARWFAPGGWRVALYGDAIAVTYQPIERGVVLRPGKEPETLDAGVDGRSKAGLHGQALAFASLLRTGRPAEGAADLTDYARSVDLVAQLTAA
jgi:predicted dehydrogenase